MTELSVLENVVRVIFPSTMMREGELLPAAFTSLGIGEYSQFHMIAIRRHLVEIAKKRMSTVNGFF